MIDINRSNMKIDGHYPSDMSDTTFRRGSALPGLIFDTLLHYSHWQAKSQTQDQVKTIINFKDLIGYFGVRDQPLRGPKSKR